ncbi:hypothetical protein ACQ856_17325 [Mycolicibacterium psychrotolerans]|uniref:hypothetical protein n=1 Tax=Mycolicibacterium psychrotolerans TaxID=216929 RepID=UPI003D667BB8
MTLRKPPGLKAAGTRLWVTTVAEFDLEAEPDKVEVLSHACRVADTIRQLELAAGKEPLTVLGSGETEDDQSFDQRSQISARAIGTTADKAELRATRGGIRLMPMPPTQRRRHRKPPPETDDQRHARRLDYYAKLRHWLESPIDLDHPEIPKGLV